jgi:hypothetical protein
MVMELLAGLIIGIVFGGVVFILKYKNGSLGAFQRLIFSILDWRTLLRKIRAKATLDVVFISNMRHKEDKRKYLGDYDCPGGNFDGPRIRFRGIFGRTRALNVLAHDLFAKSFKEMSTARRQAKDYYMNASQWANEKGARVALSGASLKDLFGRDAKEPKKKFPEILFTKGDNGTVILFWRQFQRAFEKAGLDKTARIGFVCPYNTNGKGMIHFLRKEGYENVVLFGSKLDAVRKVSNETGYSMADSYVQMGKVDAIICCSHSDDIEIGVNEIDSLRKRGRKLLVLSVTQPPNPSFKVWQKCRKKVLVINTGNGFSKHQKYIFGNIAARAFGFASQRWNFGCYYEAIALAYVLKNKITKYGDLFRYNWFNTNEEQMLLIEQIFQDIGISPFPMASYTEEIRDFNLDYKEELKKEVGVATKEAKLSHA